MKSYIDTSFLRNPDLAAELRIASGTDRFILGDTVVLETMKNEHWELTARKSFEIISRHLAKVFTATEPSKLMITELETARDTEDVVDAQLTGGFRQLLGEIASVNDGPAIESIRQKITSAQEKLAGQQQNHSQNLASLKAAFESVKELIDRKDYQRLSTDAIKRYFRLQYEKTIAEISAQQVALEEVGDAAIGDTLAAGRGFMIRLQIGYNLLEFRWFVNQGLDSFPEQRATNELMDLSHAVTATFCDRILTEETWLATMRQDILDALDVAPITAPPEPALASL